MHRQTTQCGCWGKHCVMLNVPNVAKNNVRQTMYCVHYRHKYNNGIL
jgi:hypothetical protein